jgi:hypothetical protein
MSRTKTTARPIQRVLDRLQNVRPSGDSWSALCPAHGDRNNSLSVAEGNDRRALIFCHAGCAMVDIVAAIGLEVSDLFPRKGAKRHGAHA